MGCHAPRRRDRYGFTVRLPNSPSFARRTVDLASSSCWKWTKANGTRPECGRGTSTRSRCPKWEKIIVRSCMDISHCDCTHTHRRSGSTLSTANPDVTPSARLPSEEDARSCLRLEPSSPFSLVPRLLFLLDVGRASRSLSASVAPSVFRASSTPSPPSSLCVSVSLTHASWPARGDDAAVDRGRSSWSSISTAFSRSSGGTTRIGVEQDADGASPAGE